MSWRSSISCPAATPASSLNAINGTTMELPGEHTALHSFELVRVPERR
jgi:hypothetical protein